MHTARLTLRQLKTTDNQALSILRSDERVNRYLDRPRSCTLQEADAFIFKILNAGGSNKTYWVITESGNDDLIGTICLWNFSENNESAEVGYELMPAWQGRGLMQEALAKVLSFAFSSLALPRILAISEKENLPSAKLLKSKGFMADHGHILVSAEESGNCNVFFLNKEQMFSGN